MRALILAVLAALVGAAFLAGAALRRETPQVEFLQHALGEPTATAPLTRTPDKGTVVRLRDGGYSLDRGVVSVGLLSADPGAGELERHANGVSRRTSYGWEAVTVTPAKTEQFLTVVERQGPKTWRWQLESLNLTPRVGDDGAVGFIRNGRLMSDVAFIEPVRILDELGQDITPRDARWSVAQTGSRWFLELALDDAKLPLPYVIDPAISHRAVGVSTPNAAANTEVVPVPAGVVAGDVLIAQLTMRGNTTITGVTGQPSGGGLFTSINRQVSGTTITQEVGYRVATATEPATSYTFALSANVKTSAGIAAYVDGANQANPINISGGQVNASSVTATAPSVTTTVANTRLLTLVGSAVGNATTTNWTGLTNERWDTSSTSNATTTRTSTGLGDEAVAAIGATGTRTATNVAAAVNIGQSVAIAPLAADGSGTLTTPTASVVSQSTGNTITFTYTADTGGMRNGSVTLVAPTGWSAPSTTGSNAGYTTSSTGTVGVAGQTITVSGVTLTSGSTLTIVYGSTASGGPGATAAGPAGAQTWQAEQRSSATSGALVNLGTSPSITITHGAAAQIALTGSTADLTSGATRLLTATVQDAAGNTVTSDNTTSVNFTKQSGAGTVTGTGTATAASGVATKTVTGSLAGAVTMQAAAGGLTTGTMGAFNVVHGGATQIALSGSTADLTSGATRLLTATVQDAAGNTVTSDSSTVVTFAKQSGAGTVTGTGAATSASGVATKTITGDLIGSVTMEATAGGLTTGTLGAFTVVHGAATQIELTGSTADLTSGATRLLTATLRDAAGNTVTSDSSTVVTFAKQSGAGTVTGTGTATASSGVATKTVTGAVVGSVTMEAASGGLTTGTLGAFTVVHGAAAQIGLTGSTADLASGATRLLTATIQDAAGNTVTSDNSTVVAFAKAAGAGTVTGTGNDTAVAGVATKTISGALAGPVTMEATSGVLTTGTLGAFTVVHGAATQIALTGATTDLAAGATRILTATIQDAAGNTVTSDNTTVVAFTKQSGTGTVTGTGNDTAASGVATKTITGGLAGSVTMEATSAGLATGTMGAFTVVAGPAAQIALTGSAANLASGATRVLTATIQDAGGNTVTSDNTTVVTFAKQSGAGTVTGTGTDTVVAGVASKTITGAVAGSVTMEATAGGLTTGTLSAFTVVHGAAAQIALTGATTDLASGTGRVLTATIQDAAGNTVTSDNTTVVTFAKASGAGTVTGTGNDTAVAGVASKTITGALVGSVTMEATSAGLTTGTLGAFTVVHGAAAQISLSGSTADLTSGATRVLTATVQDAAGNTVTSDNTTVVTFAKQSGAGTVTGTGSDTAVAGVASKTITGAVAGSVAMEATAGGLTTGTLGAFTVVHGTAAQISLTGSTANLASGTGRVLTATVQDAAGNTVTNDNTTVVAFTKQSGAGTVTGTGNDTAVAGVATKTITGVLAGPVTMEAASTGLTTGTLGFTIVHGAATQIALTGSTADLASGAARVLTATIKDAAGNTVTSDNSTVVAFAQAAGDGTVTGTGTDTTVAGVASKTITGALVGSVTIEAAASGLTTGTLGAFTVVHGAAAQISLTGSTANLASGSTRVLTATVQDAAGNTVTNDNTTVVTFAQQSGAGTVTGTGTDTAASGVASKTVTGAIAGSVTMEASAASLTTGTLGAFTVVHGPAADIVLTGATTDLASGTGRLLTATIKDAAGNTVTSDNSTVVAFAQASGAGTVTGTGSDTAVAGVASTTVTGQLAGSVTMEATATGLTTGTLGAFTVVHGAATQIALTGSTADLASGSTRLLTATIQDAAGNTVTSDNSTVVAFAKASGAGSVTGTGNDTAVAGVASKTVTGQLAGAVTMEATSAGLTSGTLGAFTVVHGAAAQIALTGSTANLASGATRVLTATIQDAAGNTVTSDSTTVVAFAKQSGTGTVTGTGNDTAVAGVASKTVTGAVAGSVTMAATSTGLTTGTLGAFTVVHGAAAQIALTGSTADLASGATRVLTATIQDAAGNTVTSDNSTVVAIAQASGAGSVTGTGTDTAVGGVATKTVTGALVGSVTMEATSAGLTAGTLGAFTVVHGAATQIALTGSTANLTSGATRVLTATVQDAAGNTVTSDNSTVVAFAQASGAGTVTGTGSDTAVAGVATKTVTGQLAGSVTMQATSAGLTTGTLGAFTVIHGAAAQIALTGATTDLTSGATRVLTATIQDAAGNTVTSDNSTVVAFAKQSGAGSVTGTGNDTAVAGVASKTVTGALAGPVTMEATSAGLTTGTIGFTIVHGAAAQIALTGSTADLASGATRVLTGTVQDAAGNTVTSDNSTVVTFAQASGAGTVTGSGNDTAVAGVATKTITGALVGSVTMEATSAGLTTGTLGAFTVVHGAAAQIELTGSTANLASGATRVLAATIQDAAGNTVTSDNTSVVTFGKDSGAGTVTGLGTDTAVAGVASKTVTGSAAGAIVLDANSGALTEGTLGFTVVHGAATQIDLAESGSTTAGDTHTLTATLKDANGNTVTSDNATDVTFAKVSGAGTATGFSNATASAGVATKTVTNRLAGQIDVDAQAAGLTTGTASYTIVVGPVSAAASTVNAAPSSVINNGTDTTTITVTVLDDGGNPLSGKTVVLDDDSATSAITIVDDTTDASGQATFTATNTVIEPVVYDATADAVAITDTALVNFIFDDSTPPTNTVTLASASGAHLAGTTLYYRPAAAGSFTLSSAVVDGGSGPGAATYPAVGQAGWTHALETVSSPAGGPYVSSAFGWTNAASGNFGLDVEAADAWAPPNTSTTTLNVTEDSSAPTASILCNAAACPATWFTSSPVSVTLTAPDAGAGLDQIRYTTDGTDPTILSGSVYAGAFTVAAEGVTTVKYRAFDRIGNDTGVLSQLVRIDTVAPQTTIDATPGGATQDTTPTFEFSANEAGSTFQYRLDGGSWTSASSPLTLGALAENTYTFDVRATDVAGNADASPASFVFTVDTTSADTTITATPPLASNATGATFSFTASDAGPSFECSLDGAAFTACSSPQGYAGLSEASHTFRVRAKDAAGNVDASPAAYTWTVDVTAPDTTILTRPDDPYGEAIAHFTFSSNEPGSSFRCRVDGGAWSACTSPFDTASLADGAHTFDVEATDSAGNADATPASDAWTTDDTNPTGSLTAPGAAVAGSSVAVSSNSADALSGVADALFEVSPAAAGTWTAIGVADTSAPYSVTWNTIGLGDGDYDLRVTTRDVAGNTFVSPLRAVVVDNTAPSLSVSVDTTINIASPDPETIGATATDTGTGIDYVQFEQCNSAGATCGVSDWTTLTIDTTLPYSVSWPIPTDGVRLLAVTAVDNAGRQTMQTVPVTVDRTAPTTALTAPVAAANLRGTAPVAGSASDPAPGGVQLVEFQLTTNGGAFNDPAFASDASAPYTGSLLTTGYPDGLYDLRTFTSDVSSNSTASSRITVRIDNTPPTGSVTAPTAGANIRGTSVALTSDSADPFVGGSASGVATVQFQRSPAGANTWTNQAATWDTTLAATPDGLYDLRVVTTDNAGNSSTSGVTTVRVDNTLPTGSVTSPATAADVRDSITLTSDSADTGSGVATVVFQRSPAGLATWTNQAATWDTNLQADGEYDVHVVTTDNAGNVFTSPAVTIRVDNTAPTGSVTAPLTGAEIGVPPVTLTSDSADGGSGVDTIVFERSPAGANTWAATAAPWNTSSGPDAVGDGSYDLRVTTTDKAGNSFTSPVVTVLVDHTKPVTSASLAPGSPSNAPVTVSFTAGDGSGSGVSTTSYSVDGGGFLQGSSVVISAPGDHSNDGNHVVQFFSTDDVGNVETPKSVNVLIDTTAPSGTPGDPGDYLRGIANLSYSTAATDVSSVQFQFSPAGMNAWANAGLLDLSGPWAASWDTTTGVADGPYDLRAVVTDSTGNVANELLPDLPKTVDNTAPAGSVTSPAAAAYVSGSVNVTASANDGAAPPASGVAAVRFEVKPSGAGLFTVFGTQTAPVFGSTYQQPLATGSYPDGPADLQVVVTDVAGNETTSAIRTINIDNAAPTVTLDDPGAAVGASVELRATSSGDTADVTFRYRTVGSGGSGTAIASDATAPFQVTWATSPAAEQQWELIAVATDGGGNVSTSAPRVVLVDRTMPTGSVTAPATGATVGGSAVPLAATASDASGSGVAQVAWQVKLFGSGTFNTVASDTSAPFEGTWDASAAPDGATDIRALITDAAGNVRTTAVIPVTVDSTGPSVTLANPGAVVSGTIALSATTGGGAVRVAFGVSPAGSGTWTEIASDTTAPFGTPFDTRTVADGLYDVRAIGYDSLGNPSSPSVRTNVRFDNVAPQLVSSAPADGSVSTSANQIVLTASEPVTAPGAQLDGAPAPAPIVSGSTLTFATGALSDGLHVLTGELEDASGARTSFRVAITIESSPSSDPPPVEKSITEGGNWTLTVPGGLVTVRMPASAWPTPPTPDDYILILRVDAGPSTAAGAGFAPGTQIVEVTARWAVAGTYVTEFREPIEIVFSNPSGAPAIPGWSASGTSSWNTMGALEGSTLPAGQADGFFRDSDGVHVLTRHLTFFGLMLDREAPTEPRHVAGVVADDGLTIRWIPGSDASGQLGNVVLYVNGEPYRLFGPTEYEAKLGAFSAGDTRTFTLAQTDAAGNTSSQTRPLRAVPQLTGMSLEDATLVLAAAGFTLGRVSEEPIATVAPGTVIGPVELKLAVESSPIDLVVARGTAAPETKLVFSVAGSKKLTMNQKRPTTIAVRVNVSRPADLTATLYGAKNQRLYTWRLKVKAGANVVKLRLPPQIRRPGRYTLTWVARAGTQTVRRTVKVTLVGPKLAQVTPKRHEVEVVLAGEQPTKTALQPRLLGSGARVVASATPDGTFQLVASNARNVGIVVVDVDAYGLGFVSDLRTVFPSLRLIAIGREPVTRTLAVRAGAVLALPRNTPARQFAKAIAAVARPS